MIGVKNKKKPIKWDYQSIEHLRLLHQQHGDDWKTISIKFNQKFPLNKRTIKQCRQKYSNYISVGEYQQTTKNFTHQQIDMLIDQILTFGLCWSKIKDNLLVYNLFQLVGCNTIKNYYYSSLKSFVIYINKNICNNQLPNPPILKKDICRFITMTFSNGPSNRNKYYDLSVKMIKKALSRSAQISLEETIKILETLQQFWEQNKEKIQNKKLVRMSKVQFHKKKYKIQQYRQEQVQSQENEREEQLNQNQLPQLFNNANLTTKNSEPVPKLENNADFQDDYLNLVRRQIQNFADYSLEQINSNSFQGSYGQQQRQGIL